MEDWALAYRRATTPAQRAAVQARFEASQRQRPDESNWAHFWRGATDGGNLPAMAAVQAFDPLQLLGRGIGSLNASPDSRRAETTAITALQAPVVAARPAAAAAPRLRPAPSAAAARPAAPQDTASFLSTILPGVRITGGDRTPERNREVGGAENSHHLVARRAVDFAPPPGVSIQQVRQAYEAAGWTVHEALDETKRTNGTGPHFHIAATPPAGGGARPGGAGSRPNLSAPNPQDLMNYIPNPRLVGRVDLPDAPQMAMPDARPLMQLADKAALLAPLQEAMAITPRDQSQDAWDRIQGLLQGAAGGAAQAGPEASLAQMILMGGGAGLAGFRDERGEQRILNREEEEAQRQVKIALAQMGYGIDTANLDTSNQNLNINWQSGEDTRTTQGTNAMASWEGQMKELMTNLGIDQGNVQMQNSADMARGQVGAGAAQDAYNIRNQGEMAGWQNDTQRELLLARQQDSSPGTPLLARLGISGERTAGESPQVTLAREAAGLIAAQGGAAGLPYLASEIVQQGLWNDKDEFPEATINAIEEALREEKPEAAKLLIMQMLQSDQEALAGLVEKLNTNKSSFVAQLMVP